MENVQCRRCGQIKPGLKTPPLPGDWGKAVLEEACTECWHAWTEEQTRLINHLGLKPFLAADKRTIYAALHDFLKLTRVEAPAR